MARHNLGFRGRDDQRFLHFGCKKCPLSFCIGPEQYYEMIVHGQPYDAPVPPEVLICSESV